LGGVVIVEAAVGGITHYRKVYCYLANAFLFFIQCVLGIVFVADVKLKHCRCRLKTWFFLSTAGALIYNFALSLARAAGR
jgi:hypothetical protein